MLLLQHFTKKCPRCKEIKLFSDFHKDSLTKSGLQSKCKKCAKNSRESYKIIESERARAFYKLNRETILSKQLEYIKNNKEMIHNRNVIYRKNNRKKINNRSRIYYLLNKSAVTLRIKKYSKSEKGIAVRINSDHKRRVSKKKGDLTSNQLLELQQSTKVCYWCKCNLKNVKVHIDHYYPIIKGGEHTLSNLVVSCQSCNNRKSAKDPIEFANSLGRLL